MPYERSFDEPGEPLGPVCRHLRSKAVFVAGQLEPSAEIERMGSGHCWCNLTQHVLGPDDVQVDRRECNVSRTCYEAVL
jgi:hypothetical protein